MISTGRTSSGEGEKGRERLEYKGRPGEYFAALRREGAKTPKRGKKNRSPL